MYNEEYTPEGLPVVSEGCREVFERDVLRLIDERGHAHGSEAFSRIREDNPQIAFHINYYKPSDREERTAYYSGALAVYELLRRQGETNKLNQE